jgi:mono/diheme cytochrome c family protein
VVAVLIVSSACGGGGEERTPAELAREGERLWETAVCAACHGADMQGTGAGPPFLHTIYALNHHSDEAFFNAAKNGAKAHHWSFGDMPPQPEITDEELRAIIAYVRERQREEGITSDPSHG